MSDRPSADRSSAVPDAAPRQVTICDVTLRDGMQVTNREARIPLELRLRLCRALEHAGLPYLEVGSYVSDRFVPSMRDTPELLRGLGRRRRGEGPDVAVLVPNRRYYEAIEDDLPIDTIALFVAASEDYSRINTRQTVRQAMDSAAEVAALARADGYRLRAFLSNAFRETAAGGSPMPEGRVRELSSELLDMGCAAVALSDTDGRATPRDVARIVSALGPELGFERLAVHLHDRHGLGITNAYVAYQEGIRTFDASVGGIGGTSSMKGSVGNIATEELVALFDGLGVATGVDAEHLHEAERLVWQMTDLVGDPPPPSKVLAETLARDRAAAQAATAAAG